MPFIAILSIYKEYHNKKNKQIKEKQEDAQKLRMNWHISNQTQEKLRIILEFSLALNMELQKVCQVYPEIENKLYQIVSVGVHRK